MSKVGKIPVTILEWVVVDLKDGVVNVKWPKGELSYTLPEWVIMTNEDGLLKFSVEDVNTQKNFWWLARNLVKNMVEWVKNWFEKKLLIMWVGYGAQLQGRKLILSLWFSHKVDFELPDSISDVKVEQDPKGNTIITLASIDKQQVWEVAAKIRSLKKPEPYKGKGVRYFDEFVKLKPWKSAK